MEGRDKRIPEPEFAAEETIFLLFKKVRLISFASEKRSH